MHIKELKSLRLIKEVLLFELDLESNIINLMREIKQGKYKLGKYREFVVKYSKRKINKVFTI